MERHGAIMLLALWLGCVARDSTDWGDAEGICWEEPDLEETLLSEVLMGYEIRLTFFGDLFWGRGVDIYAQKQQEGYAYPFEKLSSFRKHKHEVWIGNLECPVTKEQESYALMRSLLKFSCKPEYLEHARRYFDIFSLANNHTNNMEEVDGFAQTKAYLTGHGFQFFGSFDNARLLDICEVVSVPAVPINALGKQHPKQDPILFPIALCGFHNVIKLPLEEELDVISEYAEHFFTIVMPHQGEEYQPVQNRWQEKFYRKMIDRGADIIVGGHTHSIQGVEWYQEKPIIYSLGNFVFDQNFGTTMYGLVYRLEMFVSQEEEIFSPDIYWDVRDCRGFQDTCLHTAEHHGFAKPILSFSQDVDIAHNKSMQPQKAEKSIQEQKKKEIGWNAFIEDISSPK